ncbi:MAG: hypothetical protein R2839_04525 [Thermomicrobiales bacterium]
MSSAMPGWALSQLHYNGGIAAAFLTHLAMATGESRWIDYARRYQRFSMSSCDEQFLTKQVCKSAWGAGLLYLATRDATYLPWIERMGRWFADGQDADGGWSNTAYIEPHPPLRHRRKQQRGVCGASGYGDCGVGGASGGW